MGIERSSLIDPPFLSGIPGILAHPYPFDSLMHRLTKFSVRAVTGDTFQAGHRRRLTAKGSTPISVSEAA